ncbi:hypothetical protein FHW83_001027 [Duganella sp. SG902]|nr:hypothetical protein [Duganella sp. SG902]NVM75247.1 hypothetical protein [Duganella sp. SG902]
MSILKKLLAACAFALACGAVQAAPQTYHVSPTPCWRRACC